MLLGLKYKHPIQQAPPQIGKERLSGVFKHSLQLPCPQKCLGDCRPHPRTGEAGCRAGSFEAVCGGPQAGPTALPSPHAQAATQQGGSWQRPFSMSLQAGSKPQTSHFTPCPALLFPPKMLLCLQLWDLQVCGREGRMAPRVIRLQKVPKNKRLISVSQLRASLAVIFRKSSSFMQRRKQMEITELIRSEEIAFWKNTCQAPLLKIAGARTG